MRIPFSPVVNLKIDPSPSLRVRRTSPPSGQKDGKLADAQPDRFHLRRHHRAGTFSSSQMMRYGNRIRIDHFAVALKSSPAPPRSMMSPEA